MSATQLTPEGRAPMDNIVEQYRDFMASIIDEDGVSMPHAWVKSAQDEMIMMALAVSPDDAYRAVLAQIAGGAKQAIFAIDRFTKAGQGTKYADVLAGHYYSRIGPHVGPSSFRPFIIECRHDPKIVEPICWTNTFWNDALNRELAAVAFGVLKSFAAEANGACHE